MNIRRFTPSDLKDAGHLALAQWGKEYTDPSSDDLEKIYQYLPRYYFHADSPYNFALTGESNELCGMLLAHPADEHPSEDSLADFITPENRALMLAYKAYLDGNRAKELRYALPHEVILALFASVRKGGGRMMMNALEAECRKKRIPGILLWTDDTCDFGYYHHNGFEEVAKMPTDPPLGHLNLTTYLFRKRF